MEKVNFNHQDYSYRDKNLNPIAIAIEPVTTREADGVVESIRDLISDPSFNPFFYSKLYRLGKSEFLARAEQARKYGKDPTRYFVHLLKSS